MGAGKRKAEKTLKYKVKDCLSCEKSFKSRNKENRVCNECKQKSAWHVLADRGKIGQ